VAKAVAGKDLPAGSPIEIWFQDEMRVGQKNGLVYQWARKGTRPRQLKDQRYANAYVFGAICPARDTGAALVLPRANADAMQHHLDEISRCVAADAHAGRLAHNAQATRAAQHQPCASAARQPGTQSGRENLAVYAPKLSLKSGIRRLRRRGRRIRFRLEQGHRRARSHRINRQAKLDHHRSRTMKIGISRKKRRVLCCKRVRGLPL
jgi:hypothetical protein